MERSRTLVALAVAATLAVAAAVVVWLLTRDDTPAEIPPIASPSATSTQDLVIVGTPGPGLVTTPPQVAEATVDFELFGSPSGNIGCVVTSDGVRCEIGDHEYPLPPEPSPCVGDWVATFAVGTDSGSPPTFGRCESDTLLGSADELAYGSATVVGDFACLSQESGMTCWNQATGHGFTVSRAAYALF